MKRPPHPIRDPLQVSADQFYPAHFSPTCHIHFTTPSNLHHSHTYIYFYLHTPHHPLLTSLTPSSPHNLIFIYHNLPSNYLTVYMIWLIFQGEKPGNLSKHQFTPPNETKPKIRIQYRIPHIIRGHNIYEEKGFDYCKLKIYKMDEGTLMFLIGAFGWELIRNYRKSRFFEMSYWGERRGRTRVEKEMKRLTDIQLNTSEGFFVQPIGWIESCYRQCVGTPRQGMLVPSSRATLYLNTNMSPEALDGLEEFSHVWLYFKFHLNTNTLKEAKAFSGAIGDNRKYTFTGKVTPPMLKEKKGVLATRTPHRPNPIGVTLAKIEAVDKRTRSLRLSACDLVNGTPVLDVKPYVSAYDSVKGAVDLEEGEDSVPFSPPSSLYRAPRWILETINTRNKVVVSPQARMDVQALQKKLKQFKNDPEAFLRALVETLEADVRSKFQTRRRMQDADQGISVEVPFDEATVQFLWREERELEVVGVHLTPPPSGKL